MRGSKVSLTIAYSFRAVNSGVVGMAELREVAKAVHAEPFDKLTCACGTGAGRTGYAQRAKSKHTRFW